MRWISTLVFAGLVFVGNSWASEYDQTLAKAMKGDYQAQRNAAYYLETGDGVAQNMIEGCKWRLIIVSTQHTKITDSDTSSLEASCSNQTVADAALTRSTAILAKIPLRARTLESDISDLTDGECSATVCPAPYAEFMTIVRRAYAGDVDAMRKAGRCFFVDSHRCGGGLFNIVQACIWAKLTLSSLGNSAARDDKVFYNNTCGLLKERSLRVVDSLIKGMPR